MIRISFILWIQDFTKDTMLNRKMRPLFSQYFGLNPWCKRWEMIPFPVELASFFLYLISIFFPLLPSSLHCPLFICAPMHTMHVRVQDMHAMHEMHVMHDRHLAYMHCMWCMIDHSLIWALMYENAYWISTIMKMKLYK